LYVFPFITSARIQFSKTAGLKFNTLNLGNIFKRYLNIQLILTGVTLHFLYKQQSVNIMGRNIGDYSEVK
jgi:hypothetical protein